MKRNLLGWALIIGMSLAWTALGAVPGLAASIGMAINGKNLDFASQPPFIDSATGRTMIPLRIAAESLGAQVAWDGGTNSAVIEKNGKTITMQVGSKNPVVNGVTKSLDAPAIMVNGKVCVPVRFVSEAMGCQVEWDEDNSCVNITTDEPILTPPPQTTSDGLLPNEDKIQKELSQEDIQRLQSYPGIEEVDSTKYFQVFITQKEPETRRITPLFLQALKIMQDDLWTVDYQKLEDASYAEDFKRVAYSVSSKDDDYETYLNKYIADEIKNKLKIKAYFLSSNYVIYHATPTEIGVRAKYIFYQSGGTKIEEEGSTLNKWYWQDVEFLFQVPAIPWEGNTVGVAYVGNIRKLNKPQPCNF